MCTPPRVILLLIILTPSVPPCASKASWNVVDFFEKIASQVGHLSPDKLPLNSDYPLNYLQNVEGFGNYVISNVKVNVFNGAEPVTKPLGILDSFANKFVSISRNLLLKKVIYGAALFGYAAYQKYELEKLTTSMRQVSRNLENLQQDTKQLDASVEDCNTLLSNLEMKLKDFNLSADVSIEEIFILEDQVFKVKEMVHKASGKIARILERIDDESSYTHGLRQTARDKSTWAGVTGAGGLAGFLIFGAPFFTLPIASVASYFFVQNKMTEMDASRYIHELENLAREIANKEYELGRLEIKMDTIMFELKLLRAKFTARSVPTSNIIIFTGAVFILIIMVLIWQNHKLILLINKQRRDFIPIIGTLSRQDQALQRITKRD